MKSLKQAISILVAIAKAKSTVVKSRSRVIKSQLMISKLLHDKKEMMSVVSQKKRTANADEQVNNNKTIVSNVLKYTEFDDYVDEHQFELGGQDVDDLGDDSGSDFVLENEVDKAADVFIRRFHMQMRIQKQESFKRYQEMLESII